MEAVTLKDVCKSFGQKRAVSNLNMTVSQGSIYGFVGPNGAGKTTTLRMLAGLARPDSGEISIYGKKVEFGKPHAHLIGYSPDAPGFPSHMNAESYLKIMGELSGLSGEKLHSRVNEMLETVGLKNEKANVVSFSRGMKQRIGLAQALISDPKVLIMDEPCSALDPLGRKEILELIETISKTTTVIFSTHILADVERICDTVGILNQGCMILEDKTKELRKKYSFKKLVVEFDGNPANFAKEIKKEINECEIIHTDNRLVISSSDDIKLRRTVQNLLPIETAIIKNLYIEESSLEDIFLRMVKNGA